MAQVSAAAEAKEADKCTSAAARGRDLQLEAEEGDAPFITEELDRQGLPIPQQLVSGSSCDYLHVSAATLGLEDQNSRSAVLRRVTNFLRTSLCVCF